MSLPLVLELRLQATLVLQATRTFEWVDPARLIDAVEATPFAFSPWLVKELADPRLREKLLTPQG